MKKLSENKNAVILLSGGLDSLTALGYVEAKGLYNVVLALTFDYGQKSAEKEIQASARIAEYYGVEHKIIKLDWLRDITKTGLVSDVDIPDEKFCTLDSAKAVWVPNRNGLFLNIAASYCDAYGFGHIIYGANRDEGATFPDNTEDFRVQITKTFERSTLVKPSVSAPLINYGKDDIVRIAIDCSIPLELVMSCYSSAEGHCGRCESCYHLKKALLANGCKDITELLFND